jgi:hypothetical protein
MTAVVSGCGPVVSPMIGRRLRSPPRDHHRADADPLSSRYTILVSLPLYFKFEHFIIYVFLL